jgi:uncharacterized coiled-coil protein SlyX
MKGYAQRRTDVTDELLARRILALEERIERVETSGPSTQRVILDALADLRRDTADRFDRVDQRFDRMDQRFDDMETRFEKRFATLEGLLGQVITLIGGLPGREPPKQ